MSNPHDYDRLRNSYQDEEQIIVTRDVPHLMECCFCFSLQTGVIILGWLTIIGAADDVATSVLLIHEAVTTINKDSNYIAGVWTAVAASLTSLILSVLLGALLLIGVYKRKPRCLTPYIIYCVVYSILILILLMLKMALGIANVYDYLVSVSLLVIKLYFAVVVNSYKQELINEQRTSETTYEPTPTSPPLVH